MNFLDMRTVIFGYMISDLICTVVVAGLWKQNSKRFAGLGRCLAGFGMQSLSLVLIVLRGSIPDILSMTGSNMLIIGGSILSYVGLERFVGKRNSQVHNYILLAVFVLVHAYFVLILPSLTTRIILLSLGLLAICAQGAWLMLGGVDREMRRITRAVGQVYVGFCLVSVARIITSLLAPLKNDFFHTNSYETLLLVAYQMLFIAMTFSLFLMVNRRLHSVLEGDIAARKRAEEVIQLRLVLWEYAASHRVEELLQRALDEIEKVTGSLIGFYHFLDEDQNELSMQAWSSRTRAEFCQAEGKGLHYSIDAAGVWVDCFFQRRPVIHNDYASLAHRKGLPAGHARVIRELLIPVSRQGKIVAILGVGNKPSNYNDLDIETVSYIADMVYSIVEFRRADELVRRLNDRLAHLAMTDELTALGNRRSFFLRGQEEIKSAQRYRTPFSLLMLDIDKFKVINDNFGHDAGDLMLQRVGTVLQNNLREVDFLARLGGEEFGILLPNTPSAAAVKLAERLRLAIEGESYPFQSQNMTVTVSIGVATFAPGMPNLDALLRVADAGLYQAKNRGRNRVVFCD